MLFIHCTSPKFSLSLKNLLKIYHINLLYYVSSFSCFPLKITHFAPKMVFWWFFFNEYFLYAVNNGPYPSLPLQKLKNINNWYPLNFFQVFRSFLWKTHILPQKYLFRKLYSCIFLIGCQHYPILLFSLIKACVAISCRFGDFLS